MLLKTLLLATLAVAAPTPEEASTDGANGVIVRKIMLGGKCLAAPLQGDESRPWEGSEPYLTPAVWWEIPNPYGGSILGAPVRLHGMTAMSGNDLCWTGGYVAPSDSKEDPARRGRSIQLYQCNNPGSPQNFYWWPDGYQWGDGGYLGLITGYNIQYCADLADGVVGPGGRIQTWDCVKGNSNQKWSISW